MPTEEQTYRANVIATLDRIEEQVKQTNGRVRALEHWRMFILGALSLLGILVSPDVIQKILAL